MFSIRKLKNKELHLYSDVLIERFHWLNDHRLNMWKLENLNIKGLLKRYEQPDFYGAFEGNICVGGFILIEQDIRYWPKNINDNAFYFHKFVVSPRYGGKGYSSKILEWVKDLGKNLNKDFIRLDYQKSRTYLRNMYLSHEFHDVSEMVLSDGVILVLGAYVVDNRVG
jgi:hypothetical protein